MAATATNPGSAPRSLFGHPPGLTVLFLTQMWAEFSYFGLQALLVYYMTERLGFSQARSSLVYGIYGGAAFFSPFFGGMIADRWLGRTRSVVAGGLLMMCGHFAMAFPAALFPALALVAIGNGLFIPPLAVQVGSLYADDDPRKAHAYSAYYMGINLGGLLAPLVCGTLGEELGWHWGFAAAGIGMLFGLIVYLGCRRLLPGEPRRLHAPEADAVEATVEADVDRRNILLLVAIVAVVILFRIGYEQSGNVIALWVKDDTDRAIGWGLTIPATWFQAINPLLIILLTPVLIRRWERQGDAGGSAMLMRRMSLGCLLAGGSMLVMVMAALDQGRAGAPVSAWWTIVYFVLLTLGELLVIPVGLALVDKLAPVRLAATAMGAWYIAKFLGSLLAGVMGSYWGAIPPALFFGLGAVSVLLAAGVLQFMGRSPDPSGS
jgi:proton-dependent oligopeptide transporter, POT family